MSLRVLLSREIKIFFLGQYQPCKRIVRTLFFLALNFQWCWFHRVQRNRQLRKTLVYFNINFFLNLAVTPCTVRGKKSAVCISL